ncbi:hypothetical protein B484DRAFT_412384, partial [Ochromonadaceae sp. CCMP2298]
MADMVRKVYIKFIQSLVEDFYAEERWRKLRLLSFVLFTPATNSPQRQPKVSLIGRSCAREEKDGEEGGYQRSGEEGANIQRDEQEGINAQLLEGEEGANGILPQRPQPSPHVQLLHVFERSQLIRVLSTCKKLVKHGLDHLRYGHLLALIRDSKHADYDHATALFGELLAEILSNVANAQIPAAVLPAFRDNELFAATKKNGD